MPSQPVITCSKLTTETLEQGVKYVQSNNKGTRTTPVNFEHVIVGWATTDPSNAAMGYLGLLINRTS